MLGPGTIGLLVAFFAQARDIEVHVAGVTAPTIEFAGTLGFGGAWDQSEIPELEWDAVVNASNDADSPARALELVVPGGRVVYVGFGSGPSEIDTRAMTLKDVTAVGIRAPRPLSPKRSRSTRRGTLILARSLGPRLDLKVSATC